MRLQETREQWNREAGILIAEAKEQARRECEDDLFGGSARDPNVRGQSVGLGNPATGVSTGNVDSEQQPNTPVSQIYGSPLALDQHIGSTPSGCKQGVREELSGNQQGAPTKKHTAYLASFDLILNSVMITLMRALNHVLKAQDIQF